MEENNVIVTGFGVFGDKKINASWESVKLLPEMEWNNLNVIVKEIPVLYEYAEKEIPLLWEKFKPKLVIHVGLFDGSDELTIESQAYRTGYFSKDCQNNTHSTTEACCSSDGADCIKSSIDIGKICEFINTNSKTIKASESHDAGRYLCEFVYYKSLNIDRSRTLFVHVPQVDKPYTAKEIAEGLALIITCALEQLTQDGSESTCKTSSL